MCKRIYAVIILCVLIFQGCGYDSSDLNTKDKEYIKNLEEPTVLKNDEKNFGDELYTEKEVGQEDIDVEIKETLYVEDIDDVSVILNKMTLEEKIGQMFICAFRKDENDNGVIELNDINRNFLQDYNIGGVVFFSENIVSKEQISTYIEDVKEISKITPFIGIDEEGGRVVRTAKLDLVQIPSAQKMAETADASKAYSYAKEIAEYLTELGFNLDFAPVADINSNPLNIVIGDRAFGNDPMVVGEMVSAFVKGLEENGINATLKHFPGHGETSDDSHNGIASVDNDLDRLKEVELIPFQMGIDVGASFVMVGHISTPKITENNEPAIFSKLLIEDVLRNQMKFEGIVVTDALDMGAVTQKYDSAQTAVKSVLAGVDVLLMPSDFMSAYNGLLEAVKSGEISEQRIDESVRRILKLKLDK